MYSKQQGKITCVSGDAGVVFSFEKITQENLSDSVSLFILAFPLI